MIRQGLIYALLTLIFFSCKKENAFDCFKSNGDVVTVSRDIDSFSMIEVNDKIDLNILRGDIYKMEITAGENIIKNISTVNKNHTLKISNNNKCNFVRGYKKKILITVTVPYIWKITNNGVGTVNFETHKLQDSIFIRAENSGDIHMKGQFKKLRTSSHGNGDIYLYGVCDKLEVYMFGTNFLKAAEMKINNYVFIETVSLGDATIKAPDGGVVEYNLWRSGNIYYSGEPSVINNFSDGSGKGQLIKQ